MNLIPTRKNLLLVQLLADFESPKPAHAAQNALDHTAIQIELGFDTGSFVGPFALANELQMGRKMAYWKAKKLSYLTMVRMGRNSSGIVGNLNDKTGLAHGRVPGCIRGCLH